MAHRAAIDAPIRMTYEEFVDWAGEDTRAEWVDGEVILLMPPTIRHQQLIALLGTLLMLFVRSKRLGTVLWAPVEMKLSEGRSYREPDIVYVSTQNAAKLKRVRIDGPADLAIEIVSEDSVIRDRRTKLVEYAAGGVREYWTVDARDGFFDVHAFRLESGQYQELLPDSDDRIYSVELQGFYLRSAWLRDPADADPLELFAEIESDAGNRSES